MWVRYRLLGGLYEVIRWMWSCVLAPVRECTRLAGLAMHQRQGLSGRTAHIRTSARERGTVRPGWGGAFQNIVLTLRAVRRSMSSG
jgi:hypothetical protein